MDVRAFGSIYGQTASLPYTSGFMVNAGTSKVFPACRAVYVESASKSSDKTLTVTLSDNDGIPITFSHIRTDVLLPISCTSVSGISTIDHIYILY